jgi:hypothetical protein
MLNCLIQGKLTGEPRTRTAANGNPYTTVTVGVDTANGSILCGVIAFDLAGERLADLHKGDGIAATGEGKLTTWEKGGEQHLGLSVTAAEVLTVHVARKRRTRAAGAAVQGGDGERAIA